MEQLEMSLSLSTPSKAWVSGILESCTLQDKAIHPFVSWICRDFTTSFVFFPFWWKNQEKRKELKSLQLMEATITRRETQ